jgi:hypothetical protein
MRLWNAILLIHGLGAGLWWWVMPGGFPYYHPRFWANEVLPLVVIAAAAAGLYGIWRRRLGLALGVILAVPAFWTAALVVAAIAFPISRRCAVAVGLIAIAMWLAYFVSAARRRPTGLATCVGLSVAMLAGAAAPLTQRARDASTKPLDQRLPAAAGTEPRLPGELLRLTKSLEVESGAGTVVTHIGALSIEVDPLLTFISCSPDRCWTILAPPGRRIMPRRLLVGREFEDDRIILHFAGDARHVLDVRPGVMAQGCTVEGHTELETPVYSHLNTFCHLTVTGHQSLALSFSPCPELRVSVEPSDYPVGRPERFAYVDAHYQFNVVEASSGEKGPFKVLGSGSLAAGRELQMTIYDDSRPVASVVFYDWAPQSSTDLSPTAGWGVPMNAIEFRRLGEAPQARAWIWLTLAGTSVGRGWDSVGHRAGTYRNRIEIKQEP